MTDRYVHRLADSLLGEMITDHSAVMVVGPRATGKTTSAERLAGSVVQLADDRQRSAFAADIEVGLTSKAQPVLVDEWQEVPDVLGHIKVLVDTEPRRGRFIITGSVRGDIDGQTWPGTGRLVRLEMYGLTEREIAGQPASTGWINGVLRGDVGRVASSERLNDYVRRALRSGFPEPALTMAETARARWLTSYVDQLVTRDAAGVDGGRDPLRLRRYLSAYTLNSAGVADDATLYSAAGIAKNTAREYARLLQNLFVVSEVPAWTSNRLKRLALAPKRYLVDPGLFVGVLGVDESEVLSDGDLLGRVIETFVVGQIRAELALMTPRPRLHHLRTAEGRHEVDLVIEVGARKLVAIEIKATSKPGPDDARHLRWLKRELGDSLVAAVLLHCGPQALELDGGVIACPISSLWAS
jgi:predicted AAA+ superfamily ATPase